MQIVTRYLAKDGRMFVEGDKCLKHEALLDEIAKVNSILVPIPKNDGCSFANGHGYIRQNAIKVDEFLQAACKLAENHSTSEEEKRRAREVASGDCHVSYLARVLDDSDSPIKNLFYRFMCIDDNNQEWGQPYYASHPEQGDQVCLNK